MLNGTDNYFTANGPGTSKYTLEFWVNPAAFPATIVTRAGASPDITVTSSGAITFDGLLTSADGLMQTTQWKHVAVTNNSGAVTIYVNGVSVANGISPRTTSGLLTFGSGLNGKLDDIRLWDTIRTAAEIAENRNTEEPAGAGSHLLLHLKLNNDLANSGSGSYTINQSTPAAVFDSQVLPNGR
jgi:hypothetical protein